MLAEPVCADIVRYLGEYRWPGYPWNGHGEHNELILNQGFLR